MASKYYAVLVGKTKGVFTNWDECKKQIHGYPGALYKSFLTLREAEQYLTQGQPQKKCNETVPKNSYEIYVDGSYQNSRYSWGFVVMKNDEIIHEDCGLGTNEQAALSRNVAGELEAVINAVKWTQNNKIEHFYIYHDYIGISEWALGRWRTNNNLTKNYASFIKEYLPYITFIKVAGHSGIRGNEIADHLAKKALQENN